MRRSQLERAVADARAIARDPLELGADLPEAVHVTMRDGRGDRALELVESLRRAPLREQDARGHDRRLPSRLGADVRRRRGRRGCRCGNDRLGGGGAGPGEERAQLVHLAGELAQLSFDLVDPDEHIVASAHQSLPLGLSPQREPG